MHVTVWVGGKAIKDFDMTRYGDSPEARDALEKLVEYLNEEARRHGSSRVYELSEMGERIGPPEACPRCKGQVEAARTPDETYCADCGLRLAYDAANGWIVP